MTQLGTGRMSRMTSVSDQPKATTSTPPSKRGRWSFSLGTLILLPALLVTVISHVRTSWQLNEVRRETHALEAGPLQRIYVRKLPVTGGGLWQWKVRVPAGNQFRFCLATQNIGTDNVPEPEEELVIGYEGEFTAHLIEHPLERSSGKRGLSLWIAQGGITSYMPMHPEKDTPVSGTSFPEIAGHGETVSVSTDERVVLIRAQHMGARTAIPAPPGPGFLLWIERIEPQPVNE